MTDRGKSQWVYSLLLGLVVVIGCLVIAGWCTHSPGLIQLRPMLPPMQLNTAAALLLGAMGMLAVIWDRPRLASALGWVLLVVGAATFAEYALSINLGLDELLARDYVQARVAHPGRMAPNTTLCFLLLGFLLCVGTLVRPSRKLVVRGALATLILALSAVALMGYVMSIEEAYSWGTFSGMSVQTAACFAMIGSVALSHAWGLRPTHGPTAGAWAPLAIGVTVGIFTILIWYSLWGHEHKLIYRATTRTAEEVAERLKSHFEARQRELLYIASGLSTDSADPKPSSARWWPKNAYPGRRGLALVNPAFQFQWLEGSDKDVSPDQPRLDRDPAIRRVLEAARDTRRPGWSGPIKFTGDRIGFVFCIPLFDEREEFDHAILSLYDAKELFDRLMNPKTTAAGYGLTVLDDGKVMYQREDAPPPAMSALFAQVRPGPEQSPWSIRVWPVAAIGQLQSPLPEVCLVAGMVMAVLTALATYHRQVALRRAADLGVANQELTQLSRSLDQRVEQRTAELASANAELEVRNHEMESFVYSVSHDLKSPIVTCRGFLGVLKERTEGGDLQGVSDTTARLVRALDRMSRGIDGLLELSRIGRVAAEPVPIDMNALVNDLASDLADRFTQKGAVLKVEPRLPTITADATRVSEALENLLTNALKYGCSCPQPTVTIGARTVGHEVRFFVADNGQGIKPDYHQKIFQLFQRLDRTQEGTGIGLTLVSRVMQVHGGRAWVESQPGQGATFYLSFPQPAPEAQG